MGTVGCLMLFMKTNPRLPLCLRHRLLTDDGRLFPERCRHSWRAGGIRRCIIRTQSTQVQTTAPKPQQRASITKKTKQEEKACANKHMHSSAMLEHSLANVCAVSTSKGLPLFKEESSSMPDCEVYEKDVHFFTSFNKENWTFPTNVSDSVRWNQRTTHTYDSCFMLPDCVSNSVKMSEEKLNVLLDDNFILQDELSRSGRPLPSDIKPLIMENDSMGVDECTSAENVDVLPVTEGSNAVPLQSGKQVGKAKRKGKKVISKKATALKHEKASIAVSEKAALQPSKKKKVPKPKSQQNLTASEVLGVLEEDIKVQEPMKDSATKAKSSPKSKTGVKKSNKLLKKEEENKFFKEVRRRGREASFNQSLAAYVSVCINLGMLNRATHTLLYYRQCSRHSVRKDVCQRVTTIKPYNIVLEGHAHKGNWKRMKELYKCLEEDEIKPNETTFMWLLSCLGRQEKSASITESIRMCLDSMEKEGISVQSVFSQAEVLQDDVDFALNAVTQLDPDFELQHRKAASGYYCNLVNELNENMYSTKVPSPAHGVATQEQLQKWAEEQFAVEASGELVINSIEKREDSKDTHHYRKMLHDWEEKWRGVLHQTFLTQLGALKKSFYGNGLDRRMSIYPYLVSLPPEEFISVMMQEIQRLARGSESFSLSKYMMYRRLGELVYMRYLVKYKKEVGILEKLKAVYKDYLTWYLDNDREEGVTYIPRVRWQELAAQNCSGPSVEHSPVEWPTTVLSSIGKFMYSIMLLKVMLWNPLHSQKHVYPAMYEVERNKGYRIVDEIKPSPSLVELYLKAAKPTLTFESIVSPMVCPPLPWVSTKLGGYLLNNAKIVRLPFNAHQQKQRMEECGNQQLYPVMDSLNQLSTIPWKINNPMLDIVIQLFNNNGCDELDIPQPPSQCPEPQKIQPGMSKAEIHKIRNQWLEYEQRKNEMHSLRCDGLYKLSMADHFRDRVLWFPHNMDFRGRVYPCPPHLNHLSSDVYRSILQFAKGEKLGPDGLHWLKLHLINLTGIVKREAIKDRMKYCDSVMEDILDSADHPLTGRRWWTKSDEPWQTLAACKELASALRSGNPEEYVSYLPVHQDGSCNGLQHYAALGRDKIGAISVNLAPSRAPQDVYSDVAVLVEAEREKDAAKGNKVAKVLEGHVKRKVIKQTVMTTVYGVTRYGARLQIEKQLKALDDFPRDQRWAASHYLVHKTFFCLAKMFTSTKEIQNWFTDCAKIVSETRGENLEYVTPLGLPVVQPYSKFIGDQTSIANLPATFCMDSFMKPNVMKQKNAFPPNFIHSLDSSHMMLTSLHCQQAGITFVSVHDCFWTHACSVDVMNKICRDQFVALHNEPILENLSKFLQRKFGLPNSEFAYDGSDLDSSKMRLNNIVRRVPHKGQFDINNVVDSLYFFS
ncbi:DNA-directed RNA polymerase, mitochondrial-like isoform X2 [Eriocheir sinensis]|uniref:DNA-directed RNA polymerase, mitochondrial-like isoform X2 n=1 Tax=Eriocheir sinensis TaxID=95602 RepID=UPI0021C627CF|nr:DNA-directed RNA polymerase, mitochondrial-like isoform X2 [Eriocheir sinensis]